MRPYLLKGHERPLTQVKYNREADLIISCAKNLQPCLCSSDNGMRIGTYEGHNGAIWTCDINIDSTRLFTASADQTVRIWDMQTGKELFQFKQQEPCRAVNLSVGEGLLAFTTDAFMGTQSMIHIAKLEQDLQQQSSKSVLSMECPKGRITRVFWSELNRCLVTAHDGGFLRKWDSETGKMLMEKKVHDDAIQDLQLADDGSYGITASLDKTAKLVDMDSFQVLKTYRAGRLVQSAAISPIMDHVILGGGQDASSVTTTASRAGGFEARFFHKIYSEEFGNVRGRFGPINTVAIHPDGRSFTTGGEDGYIRLHHMDSDYFSTKFF